jgi:phosphatidylserine/phosphatidylglycerophosphate/cardiolipin synthase-like enzyme
MALIHQALYKFSIFGMVIDSTQIIIIYCPLSSGYVTLHFLNQSTFMILVRQFSFLVAFALSSSAFASTFPANTHYDVCFTPGGECTTLIVSEINKAKKSVYLQAYSFTSQPIASAVVAALHRGVSVEVILDKSQVRNNQYSAATFLLNQQIPTWIDDVPAIAHNKVIIIDGATIITGSFNFTKAAQYKNAENVLVIHDPQLAASYMQNFLSRKNVSAHLLANQNYTYKRHKQRNTIEAFRKKLLAF